MNNETNDMIPDDPGKKLPASAREQLRANIPDGDLNQFRDQVPAEFLSDAAEGLDQVKDARQLDFILKQLNKQMHHQLTHKKSKRKRHSIANLSWTYWAIILIFLLTIVSFILVRMTLKN